VKITAITCACHRPDAWKLCEKYMASQTVQPFQWIVLDDDSPATVCTMGQQYIRVPKKQDESSLCSKLDFAIKNKLIGGDAVVFWENDDFYARDWIEFCANNLRYYDLIGEGRAVYYNVKERWWYEHHNMGHSSLCSTAMKVSLLPALLKASQSKNPFVDARLWRDVVNNKKVFDPILVSGGKRMVVGIKAMPGRTGYGGGHVVRDVSARDDLKLEKLRELIGADFVNYEPFNKEIKNMEFKTETAKAHGGNWMKWLGHLAGKPNVKGMEIGTFKGESAEFMLEFIFNHPTSEYVCVDPFTGNVEHAVGNVDCSTLESESREKLSRFNQCRIIKGYSSDVISGMLSPGGERGTYDFIYVDGGHDAMNVLRDSVLSFDLLKPGGILIWDDYLWDVFPNPIDCPKMAIDTFLACYSKHYKMIQSGTWQVCVEKK
jgi:predicted O-methyltransferase YrrM